MKEKFNGVLLHIGSLPSEYGVGALSEGAFSFVDFLADAKVDFWQTLPLSPTSFVGICGESVLYRYKYAC